MGGRLLGRQAASAARAFSPRRPFAIVSPVPGGHRMSTAAPLRQQKPGVYEVPKPGGTCAVCGRAIGAGEKFVAALRETPTGLERLDVGPECWDTFEKGGL